MLAGLIDKLVGFNFLEWAGAISLAISGLIPLMKLIPGDVPDKQLQAILDLFKKIPSVGAKK